jgi:nucleoside-diphosphate-sugar epimerase
MKVAVFGATGQIGRLVVAEPLAADHTVTAYVRNPAKLDDDGSGPSTVIGELSDPELVRQAVRGADAVISALGPSLKRSARDAPVTPGTRNIVAAMEAEKVNRYIGLATPSVADERDRPTLKARVLPVVAGLLFPNALAEARRTRRRRVRCEPATSDATRSDRRCHAPTSPPSWSPSSPTTRSPELHRSSATEQAGRLPREQAGDG